MRRETWDSVTGSSAATIRTAASRTVEPGTEIVHGPLRRRAQGADGMAAPDLPRSLRSDRTLLDLRRAGATVSDVLDRPRIIAEPSRVPRRRRGADAPRRSNSSPSCTSGSTIVACKLLEQREDAAGAVRRGRASRFPRGHARHSRSRLDGRRHPARPARSPRRDHRPDQRQDADQRAQLAARRSSWPISRTRPRRPGTSWSRAR